MNGGERRTPAVGNAPQLRFGTESAEGDHQGGKDMRARIVSHLVAVMGILVFSVPVAQAGSSGGGRPPGLPGGTNTVASVCRLVDGEDVQVGVHLQDAYGGRDALIRSGRLLCTSVTAQITSL